MTNNHQILLSDISEEGVYGSYTRIAGEVTTGFEELVDLSATVVSDTRQLTT